MSRAAAGLIFAALLPTAAAWLYFVTFADASFMPAVYLGCKVVQFTYPLVWFRQHRPERTVRPVAAPRGLILGAASGLAIAGLMWAAHVTVIQGSGLALAAQPRIAARIAAIGVATPAGFLAMTLLISVVHSFLEEYYWRWFLFGELRARQGAVVAGAVSSIAFASHHVIVIHSFIGPGPNWWVTALLSLGVALGGLLWAWLYARTGSLISPWLSHALVDFGIMAVGFDLGRSLY